MSLALGGDVDTSVGKHLPGPHCMLGFHYEVGFGSIGMVSISGAVCLQTFPPLSLTLLALGVGPTRRKCMQIAAKIYDRSCTTRGPRAAPPTRCSRDVAAAYSSHGPGLLPPSPLASDNYAWVYFGKYSHA